MDTSQSHHLAMLLAARYLAKSPEQVKEYIDAIYPNARDYRIDTSQVYLVEVDWGRFQTGDLSSNPIQWWQVTRQECTPIPLLEMNPFHDACDRGHKLWLSPIVSFFVEMPRILTMEGFGPRTRCKRILNLSQSLSAPEIQSEEIIWKLDN